MATTTEKLFRPENIEKYVSEGWKFRVKQVGSHRYILRYKGKEEKSLGSYSDELWTLIEEKGGEKAKPRRDEMLSIEIKELKERISRLEGFEESVRRKSEGCPQIGSWFGFTYCRALNWEKKPTRLMLIYPQFGFKRIMPDRVKKKWHVEPHPDLCRACPMLLQIPSTLADDVHQVERDVDKMDNDLYDVKSSLKDLKEFAEVRAGSIPRYGCKHLTPDGYCGDWHYYQRRLDREQKEDTITKDGKLTKVYRDNVKKNPLICASCPSFEPRGPNA